MTKVTHLELRHKLGRPLTEQHAIAGLAVRGDCFRCSCLRVVRAWKGQDELEIEFRPCQVHQQDFEGVTVP